MSKKFVKIMGLVDKFFYDWRYFWFKIAYYNILSFFCKKILVVPNRFLQKVQTKKNFFIKRFLSIKFSDFIQKYANKENISNKNSKKIWCCRLQWEDKAPDIVKICINSLRKNAWDFEVIVIDDKNYKNYVEFPTFLLEKLKKWKISLTHFADVLRIKLLKEYGWVWVDATMFISVPLFWEFDGKAFNSVYPQEYIENHYEFSKWCVFFFWWSGKKLFSFVYNVFIEYLKDYDKMIDFFLLDHLINIAYENFPDVKHDIDQVSLRNNDIFKLVEIFNQEYDKSLYDSLLEIWYFKLTYKIPFVEYTKDWKLTNYGKFLKDFSLN